MISGTKESTKERVSVKNNWASVGLVLGILSILFAFIGLVPLSGLVVNTIGIFKARSLNNKGMWQAIVGLLLSAIFTIVYLQKYGYIKPF